MSDDPASAEAFRWELEQAIEPTEGEIVDVLNNYLNSGSRDTFHQILIGRAIAEIKQLREERDEAWLEKGRIMNEIDCRIEHGADSNGHLEAIRKLFSKQALEKMTRLDEEMGLL